MAILDLRQNRIVTRVVYDGHANAGKTTNLQQLCKFFTTLRRSEMYTPEESEGRTLFFDALQLDGGLVSGHRLRCQLFTVPGQRPLAARRAQLLATADVVVYVCDSRIEAVDRTRRHLDGLREDLRSGDLRAFALVVQANKQDEPGALPPGELALRLGIGGGVPVVAATAHQGIGVRETIVLAIRAAANHLQKRIADEGIGFLAGEAQSGEDLYNEMRAQSSPASEPLAKLTHAKVPDPAPSQPVRSGDGVAAPPLPPQPNPRNSIVWPSKRGRQILGSLGEERLHRADLGARSSSADGSGKSDGYFFRSGQWCLKTSVRRRHSDIESGRAQLLRTARFKVLLSELLLPDTTLALQPADDGSHWLWTVAPWVTTIGAELVRAAEERDTGGVRDALVAYARAAVRAIVFGAHTGVELDVHPGNFARSGDKIWYIDDDFHVSQDLHAIGHAILRRFDEYASFEGAVDGYLEVLQEEFCASVPPEAIRLTKLQESIAHASVRSTTGLAAREFLLQTLHIRASGGA